MKMQNSALQLSFELLFPCSKSTGCQSFYYSFLMHCMQNADMEVLPLYKKNDRRRFNPQNRCTH